MKRVFYAEQTFLTDSRVADALLEYARVLATVGQADVVEVPGVDRTDVLRVFELVIGPASQMAAHETDDDERPMRAEAAIADLAQRTAQRLPSMESALSFGAADD